MAAEKKPAAFKPPKTLGACADLLFTTRNDRLTLQKQVDALSAQETSLKDHIIATLPKSDSTGVAGKLARVTVVTDEVPQVKDWDLFYAYVHKNKAYELLNRALSKAGVTERLEAGKKVAGVEMFPVVKVSINKV